MVAWVAGQVASFSLRLGRGPIGSVLRERQQDEVQEGSLVESATEPPCGRSMMGFLCCPES